MTDDRKITNRQTLKPGDNSGVGSMGNTYSPLIPFNCLFDVDVGLIQVIRQDYRSGGIFDIEFIDRLCHSRKDLIYHLYTRKNANPLYELMLEPDINIANELYQEFKEKIYDRMIDNCVYTGIFDLCAKFSDIPEIHAAIYYSNPLELELLNTFSDSLERIDIISDEEFKNNRSKYSQYFVKYIDGEYIMSLLKYLDHKSIYVLKYMFNFEKKENGLDLIRSTAMLGLEVKRNQFIIVDAFDDSKLGKEN